MIHSNLRWSPLALAALMALGGCGEPSETERLDLARKLVDDNDPAAARLELKALLQQNTGSPEARFLLAELMQDAGENAAAEAELNRALEAGHPAATVLPLLAAVMLAQGKGPQLLARFGSAADLPDPGADATVKTHLASAHLAAGDATAAKKLTDLVLDRMPGFLPAKILRVRLIAAGGDRERAIPAIEQLLREAPDNAQAWALAGDLRAPTGPGKHYGSAIEAWRKSLALGGQPVALHAAVVSALMAQGDFVSANAQWALLKQAAAAHPQTAYLEAQLAEQRGDFARAREISQKLLLGASGNLRVLLLAGKAEQNLGGWAQAEVLFSKAVQLAPTALPPRLLLAGAQVHTGQADNALATLQPLLAADPPDIDALSLAAQAQLRLGDLKAADALFAQAAKINPNDVRVRTALALSMVARGQTDAGINALQAIASTDSGTSADLALILAKLRRNDKAGASAAIDALATKTPKDPLPDELRARVALGAKDKAAGRKHLDAALQKNADYMPALMGLTHLDLAERKAPAARARFEEVLQRNPRHLGAMQALAMINARSGGQPEASAKWLEQAVQTDPNDAPSRLQLIDLYLATDQARKALIASQSALVVFPSAPDLLERLGRAQLATGEPRQAIISFNKWLAQQPKSATPHLHLAEAYEVLKDDAAAAVNLRRAVALEPDSLAVQKAAVRLAMHERKPAEALAATRRIQAKYPGLASGFILEGNLALLQKQWDNAANAFRKASTRTDPGESAQRLYTSLLGARKQADADKFAGEWQQRHPKDVNFMMHVADTAMVGGRAAQAEPMYRQVLQLAPNHVLALNNLAFVLASQKKPGAVAYAEQALRLSPGTASVMDTLALSLAGDQKFEAAAEVQAQAVKLAPDVPTFRLQWAQLLVKAGDKDKARAELRTLARLGPAFARQPEVTALLKSTSGG